MLSACSNARSCCQVSLVHQSSLGRGQPCPGGGGFPGLAECLLVEEKSMPSQGFLPRGWFIHPVTRGERVTFAAVPAWAACLASMERFCPVQRRGEAAASPAVSNGITQNEGHHRTESNCGVFENAHSSLHRAAAVHCKGDSFLAWFLRGGGFCLLICQLPPAIARFVSLPASLKHYKI